MNGWTLTDDGDSYQHVRKIDDQTFELIEMATAHPNRRIFEVYTDTLCLSDYPDEEVADILLHFGYKDMQEVILESGDETNQIIAECIFEHYGSFAAETIFRGPFYASQCFIDEFIRKGANDNG